VWLCRADDDEVPPTPEDASRRRWLSTGEKSSRLDDDDERAPPPFLASWFSAELSSLPQPFVSATAPGDCNAAAGLELPQLFQTVAETFDAGSTSASDTDGDRGLFCCEDLFFVFDSNDDEDDDEDDVSGARVRFSL
jgi:hypothetical protein